MRLFLIISAIVLWAVAVALTFYEFYPRQQTWTVSHLVPESSTRYETHTETVDGKPVSRIVPVRYVVYKPVFETRTREPSREEQLRFVAIAGAIGLLYLYCFIMMVLFAYYSFRRITVPKHIITQLTIAISFLVGAVGGFFTSSSQAKFDAPQQQVGSYNPYAEAMPPAAPGPHLAPTPSVPVETFPGPEAQPVPQSK